MKKSIFAAALAVGAMLTFAVQAAEPPKDPPTLKIGMITALSGKFAYYGEVHLNGAKLAVDEINAAGGIDGVKLELVAEDHKGSPRDAVTAFNKLTSLDGVQAVLTAFSPPTLAIAPIADERGVFVLNGGGVNQAMVGTFKSLFHNRAMSADLGIGVVAYAREKGYAKMAEIAWRNDAGEAVIAAVEPLWKEGGGSVTSTEMMEPGATNVDTQIAKIRVSKPDFVGMWAWSPDPGLIVKRMREAGIDVPIIGVDYSDEVQRVGGSALEGYIFCQDYFTPSGGDTWSQRFWDAYTKRFGADPEYVSANYYEGVYVIAEMIRRARNEGGDYYHGTKLISELWNNPTFDSVYGGTMTFQPNGVAAKKVGLFEVQDGKAVFQKYIKGQ